tara:strand:- start:200 stop:400 length:201 start_codon:yes stop_codon:yes gene_type:complete
MNQSDRVCITIIIVLCCALTSIITINIIKHGDRAFKEKYHCVPMPEPTTLEEAKKRIAAYQAAIKG